MECLEHCFIISWLAVTQKHFDVIRQCCSTPDARNRSRRRILEVVTQRTIRLHGIKCLVPDREAHFGFRPGQPLVAVEVLRRFAASIVKPLHTFLVGVQTAGLRVSVSSVRRTCGFLPTPLGQSQQVDRFDRTETFPNAVPKLADLFADNLGREAHLEKIGNQNHCTLHSPRVPERFGIGASLAFGVVEIRFNGIERGLRRFEFLV